MGSTEIFAYDGMNRQVSRRIGPATPLYNVYDGWNLIGEYQPTSTTPLNAYLHGAAGLVKLMTASSSFYYYQDASGSTSHLADSTGHLVEWYRYDLQGTPVFYNAANTQIPSSSPGVRHLFTGQQWYSDIGLYDLRNRFYSPDSGRFLQPDPISFFGDRTNLYRYVRNNPLKWRDPFGLDVAGRQYQDPSPDQIATAQGVVVNGGWAPGPGAGETPTPSGDPFGGSSVSASNGNGAAEKGLGADTTERVVVTGSPVESPNTYPINSNQLQTSPTPSPTPRGLSPQTMKKAGVYILVGGGVLTLVGGVMQFTPAAPAGWVIGGVGVVTGVMGGFVWVAGYFAGQAGAEGY